jgi:hypothetical protein
MKTYFWIDDGLREKAERAAAELGWSQNTLVAEALREFLQRRRDLQTTEQLNAVYGEDEQRVELELVRNLRAKLPVANAW